MVIPLLDVPAHRLAVHAAELGCESYGQLQTPRRGHTNWGGVFAIDNCAFSDFDAERFLSLLEREKPNRDRCWWVAVPDVVGSARRTLELFRHWYPKIHYPVALVMQDGIEDLDIPWNLIAAAFIGGTDKFKNSSEAEAVIRCAKACGKRVHVGRVNTPARWEKFLDMGVDSVDGSGLARPGGGWLRERLKIRRRAEERESAIPLFTDGHGASCACWDCQYQREQQGVL
jgi:hypothetical protein